MLTIRAKQLQADSDGYKQMGNHVFARSGDLVGVYEILSYTGYEPEMLKDLCKTYVITDSTTYEDLADKFFGNPTAPDFTKVLK